MAEAVSDADKVFERLLQNDVFAAAFFMYKGFYAYFGNGQGRTHNLSRFSLHGNAKHSKDTQYHYVKMGAVVSFKGDKQSYSYGRCKQYGHKGSAP